MASIFDHLDDKYVHFRTRALDAAFGKIQEDHDKRCKEFRDAMQEEFENLTPEQRIEIFEFLLDEAENQLDDAEIEHRAGEAIQMMALIQILRQLVPED